VALVCSLRSADAVGERDCGRDVSELIAYARSNPGKLSIAFDNTAGAAAFAAKLFNSGPRVGLVEVPVSIRRADDPGRRQGVNTGDDDVDRRHQRDGAGRQGAPARRHLRAKRLSRVAGAAVPARDGVPAW
jgi:hypothetical protein